eukprot:2022656-Rhodomonas_salina.2
MHTVGQQQKARTDKGATLTVRRDGDAVEVAAVADQVLLELAAREVPDLDQLVPAAGHDNLVLGRGREAHTAHPLAVTILVGRRRADGVLAVPEGVPQLDGLHVTTQA